MQMKFEIMRESLYPVILKINIFKIQLDFFVKKQNQLVRRENKNLFRTCII